MDITTVREAGHVRFGGHKCNETGPIGHASFPTHALAPAHELLIPTNIGGSS
jgi:hypothetical protein